MGASSSRWRPSPPWRPSSTRASRRTGGSRTWPGERPRRLDFGREIDSLFLIILFITGARLHRHAGRPGVGHAPVRGRGCPGPAGPQGRLLPRQPALEVIWTIIPAAILVFIALYQMGTWAEIKFRSAAPKVPPSGGDHRAAVPVGDARSRPRRPAQYPRRPREWWTTCISSGTRRRRST